MLPSLVTKQSLTHIIVEGESSVKSKDDLKAQLHHVIVHILRKRPKLAYFQVGEMFVCELDTFLFLFAGLS